MKSANAQVVPFPGEAVRRERQELAFLPAALEVVDTPPSPLGRAISFSLIGLFCIALGWAWWGEVDLIASAPGKIMPTGHSKTIQAFDTGVIRAIHVQDGQSVKTGDLLIELDPTLTNADREHLQNDLFAQQLEIARLQAGLSGAADPETEFHPPPGVNHMLLATQRRLLREQTSEQNAKISALEHQRLQKKAERETALATIARFEATIPVLQQQNEVHKTLYERGNGSKLQYLQTLEALTDKEQELLVQRSRVREADAALAAIEQGLAQAGAEHRRQLSDQLATAQVKVAGLTQDLAKAQERGRLQQLVAPIDGVVQQLAVHTVGGVVTPAQALMVLVPADARLEIEAMMPNREIGFVQAGQDAEIKVDSFNFTRYGLRHGRVLSVSQDAIVHEHSSNGRSERSHEANTSEPQGEELVYAVRVSLDRTQMKVAGGLVNLVPGMATTVEIKTGRERIISYLLSPMLRLTHDSMRER